MPSAMKPASARPRGAAPPRRPTPEQRRRRRQRRDPDQGLAAQPAERRGAELQPLVQRVDQQVDEQPDGQGQHEAPRRRPGAAQRRVGHQPDRHRREPEQQADQRQRRQRARREPRRRLRHLDRVVEGGAGAGDEREVMRLALDPGIGDVEPRRAEPADRRVRRQRELAPGAVHLHLGERDRRRAVGPERQRDQPGRQPGRLDRQLLDRRGGAGQLAQRLGDAAGSRPRPRAARPAAPARGRAHHATSKWLIQPSSANSDWWAWNM